MSEKNKYGFEPCWKKDANGNEYLDEEVFWRNLSLHVTSMQLAVELYKEKMDNYDIKGALR